jgi:hypothetical protein
VLRVLPALIELTLLIYCLIDAIQTPESEMRNLPKVAWIVLVLLVPVIGPVAWLLAGRPTRNSTPSKSQRQRWEDQQRNRDRRRPRGPDDDPDFLKDL